MLAGHRDLALAGALACAVLARPGSAPTTGCSPPASTPPGDRAVEFDRSPLLLAGAVLVGVQALGNLLVVAALVAPAVAARALTRRVAPMIVLAGVLGATGAIAGLYVSYYAHVAAGAAIAGVLVATAALARLR